MRCPSSTQAARSEPRLGTRHKRMTGRPLRGRTNESQIESRPDVRTAGRGGPSVGRRAPPGVPAQGRVDGRDGFAAPCTRRIPMKRLLISAISVMALLLSAGTAIAADGTTVETVPMHFAQLDHACSSLPREHRSPGPAPPRRSRQDRRPAQTMSRQSAIPRNAHGFATDQDGKSRFFIYNNTFRISNTVANPTCFRA